MLLFLTKLFAPATIEVQSYGLTDRGMVRENNEDNFGIMAAANIFMVADGMGGHNGGEVASKLAIDTLIANFPPDPGSSLHGNATAIRHIMTRNFEVANEIVRNRAKSDPDLKGMGCTLACVIIDGRTLHCCHVGDARAYLYSPADGLVQITTDHTTLVQYQMALESEETMPELPPRNVVTRVIGYPFPEPPEYHAIPLAPGSRVFLCSDGLWSMLDENQLAAIISTAATPKNACEEFIRQANEAGGTDNITALALFC